MRTGSTEHRSIGGISRWDEVLSRASKNQQTNWWSLTHVQKDSDPETQYRHAVHWTTKFLGIVDHAHKYGGLDV